MVRRRKNDIDRSNGLKLLIDEYYGELEGNLRLMGGLDQNEICAVIENELKGLGTYIENLIKK